MNPFFKDLVGIVGAFIAWWAVAVLLGMLMFAIWPPATSYTAGISLAPQNIPGNLAGFILALYAFRSLTKRRSRTANGASKQNTDA